MKSLSLQPPLQVPGPHLPAGSCLLLPLRSAVAALPSFLQANHSNNFIKIMQSLGRCSVTGLEAHVKDCGMRRRDSHSYSFTQSTLTQVRIIEGSDPIRSELMKVTHTFNIVAKHARIVVIYSQTRLGVPFSNRPSLMQLHH